MDNIRAAAENVFREESGRILAGLIRISGSFDRAEEAMQEAFASALDVWRANGLPQNPAAWITAASHRKLIDSVRRENTRRKKQDSLAYETNPYADAEQERIEQDAAMQFPDDRLRLIFTCCHPALNENAQVALTLRTLGGLSTPEIAKAFLLPEATLAQRLVRAKRKIHEAEIPFEEPAPHRLQERLASVHAVLYLIFNEGYAASSGTALIRGSLCTEAIRLCRVLCDLLPDHAEGIGLLALMILHDSRRDARMVNGLLVTLEEQDRSRWHPGAIAEGISLVEKALQTGPIGPYQLQAAIAALHAEAATSQNTDWQQIAALYEKLFELNPSPIVTLNQAVAIAMWQGAAEGLERIDTLGDLDHYYLFHAARADLLRRLNRRREAIEAYERAFELTTNDIEQKFLLARIRSMHD